MDIVEKIQTFASKCKERGYFVEPVSKHELHISNIKGESVKFVISVDTKDIPYNIVHDEPTGDYNVDIRFNLDFFSDYEAFTYEVVDLFKEVTDTGASIRH